MIKPASLRAALVAAIPTLAENPDKLTVFIDQGSLAATGTISSSFEYRYVLNVIVLDFAGDADDLFIAIVDWVRKYQSDLVSNFDQRSNGITFEIDILDNATADVSIKLQMTESVVVGTGPTGERTVTHIDDSQALADSITWTGEPWPKS
ncbi:MULTISPECIES: phage tail protein [unclassified Caballeronia]|uniref:phage tail protein n=1 Tax=unclassified Caballeronia TaxID=2646786 RepID=UPI002027E24A|nr:MULTISPECIES: phage tail protein [unclassified Caballeronia]MDR5797442.1 phage tail protein [Caballeronia sp. LZ008]